jgi:S-adenosylmethionine synthetase
MEIIERKGKGHPDTIADNLAECLANKLRQAYIDQYNKVQHYNVDKVLVSCGQVKNNKMSKPVRIVFSGNATKIKINKLLKETVQEVLKLEIERGLKYKIYNHISYCSPDLTDNFNNKLSNDTSFSVGSPLTKNEDLVLRIGKYLESLTDPKIGTDYKIMFLRDKITLALALRCKDRDEYNKTKVNLKEELENKFNIKINLNTADNEKTCFNTVTGTSLEQGDAGMVGRGNRYNGLITPMKPMTMEAYYGKNDVTHVGRIYQKLAHEEAQRTKQNVLMVTNIGAEIDKPLVLRW